ncbi:tetratricopeptide repeat protein [Acidipila rosea]|uniref:Tetratricopeptide repeat protein n=1 Tax=Acidipila rosea TaxID=768535 RepID=A0A4R1KVQ4_9BACT|nr:surface-adhesin E family protein [Acidipila rosea]TCK68449.1 tetratricopeptide repeat protein [Acidipila rosea]
MARSSRFVLLALLLAVAAVLIYRYRQHSQHLQNGVADTHPKPILIPGVTEPEEMRVEPFPKSAPTAPERMLGDAMKEIRGNSDPNALLPALDSILAKYPDYGDGYVMRLASLCNGKNHAAILSDINNALKYNTTSEDATDTKASMLSMKAKLEHDGGDDTAAMRDLDTAIHANLADAARFTNSGATAPGKTASACTWTEIDMDQLKQRFPNDYRSYLFAGLYYGFFSTWNDASLKPAMDNFAKAAELNPTSALPYFYKAHVMQQATFLKSMNWSDAQRAELNKHLLDELSKALALDPNLLPAITDRAEVYFSLKQFQQAIPDYDKAIALDPKDYGAYNDRGLSNMELGKTYDAISDFSDAIRLKPRELQKSDSYENRADAYLKTEQWALAIRDLTTAISLQTGGVSFLMNINQFRAIYPEYKPASDEAVALKLNQTFFPNLKYEDFSKSFLHDNVEKGFFSSSTLPDLYVKRSDAYLKEGDWHSAAVDFRRAANGFKRLATADRWRSIGTQQNSKLYIDMQTFDDSAITSMKLWTKQTEGTTDDSGPYSLDQYEFNCTTRQLRTVSFARYSATGNLLASRGDEKWESSIPDTLGETLLNDMCRSQK